MDSALIIKIRELFDLRNDTDYENTDVSIRQNVNFKSANAWTLVFAIFIASVGLNVNSTAVIIGAMLISPLMGPIVGAGFALGINDFDLLKTAGRNLLIALGISVVTSTLYFLISPFSEAQSELLARTSPTFYDVLIAGFGGAAGIVAISRKEKSNAIPGVAIATALMPPLCTAGFGIANGEPKYFLGALYLFIINSVFICLTTYVFVRYLKFKKTNYAQKLEQIRIDRWIMIIATVVIVPSLITAWLLMQESSFRLKANSFMEQEVHYKGTFVMDRKITYRWEKSQIELTFVGTEISKEELKILEGTMHLYGLKNTALVINQVTHEDRATSRGNRALSDKTVFYQHQVSELQKKIQEEKSKTDLEQSTSQELKTFNEDLLSSSMRGSAVYLVWKSDPNKKVRLAVENFLKVRLKNEALEVLHTVKI
jgi:uncharacterized hydrophobic protein (TIGR00271 family)